MEDTTNSPQTVSQKDMSVPQDMFPKMSDMGKQTTKQSTSYDLTKIAPNQFTKRGKLDTPQWSTESQVSQESSDDVLQTSESDKSHKMSHNSTISQSPLPGQDLAIVSLSEELPTTTECLDTTSNFENKEILSNIKKDKHKINSTPVLPKPSQTPPTLPLPSIGGHDESKNMYKLTTGISHRTANKVKSANVTPPIDRHQVFHNQQVNLETLPDNSEQPDHVPNQQFSKVCKLSLS